MKPERTDEEGLDLSNPEFALQTATDLGKIILAAGLGPIAAAVASTDVGIGKLLSNRTKRFVLLLRDDLERLQTRVDGLTPEALAQDEAFVSTLIRALNIAVATHQAEKLEALRNAVLNAAVHTVDDEEQSLFLNLIDQLSPVHLRLLAFLHDPCDFIRQRGFEFRTARSKQMEARDGFRCAFPDLSEKMSIYSHCKHDLTQRGLVDIGNGFEDIARGSLGLSKWTNEMGDRFLAFVTAPPAGGTSRNNES